MRLSFWMLAPVVLVAALGCEASGTQLLTTPQDLTVSLIGAGQGAVSSSPEGIDCGSVCTKSFPGETTVTLTATAAQGSSFAGWGGDCVVLDAGAPDQCTVVMDKAKSVLASFVNSTQGLSVSVAGDGAGQVSSAPTGISCSSQTCSATFPRGATVTLTATANGASTFTGWSGDCTGTAPTCTVTLDQLRSVTATFAAPQVPLSVAIGGAGKGTVTSTPAGISCTTGTTPGTCDTTFAVGTLVLLTEVPKSGSRFLGWSGDCSGTATTCTVTLDAAKNVTANYELVHTVTVAHSHFGAGTITSNPAGITCAGTCSAKFSDGAQVTLTATPPTGAATNWQGCDSVSPDGNTCTINSLTAARTVTPYFEVGALVVSATLQGAHLAWTLPTDPQFDHVTVTVTPQGGTASAQDVTTASLDLSALLPGTSYAYTVQVGYSDATFSPGLSGSFTTAFSGTVADFVAGQQLANHGLSTGTFPSGVQADLAWYANTLYLGVSNGGTSLLGVSAQAIWIGIDTDPGSDATGSVATTITGSSGVIWPFKANFVLQLLNSGGTVSAALVDPTTGVALASQPSDLGHASSAVDEVSISKADLGNPTAIRFALVSLNRTSGASNEVVPGNAAATDVFGKHTSLTSGFDPGANLFQDAHLTDAAVGVTTVEAPALVAISVQDSAPAGALKLFGNVAPLDTTLANSIYSLRDDGAHGDGAPGDHVYGGRFNFGGSKAELAFEFADNGTMETGFGSGVDRVHTFTGAAETLHTLTFGQVWTAANPFTIQFVFTDPGAPTELQGNVAEMGAFVAGSGLAPLTNTSGTSWTLTHTFAAYDLVNGTADALAHLQWSIGYASTVETGAKHVLDDDVIDNTAATPQGVVLQWTAGDGTSF